MADAPKNIYSKLGVKTLINAQGTYTTLGGSLMPPEVLQAMNDAAGWFVSIPELQEKVGERIAGLLKVPAAMVTAGAASAITVATAACMVRDNPAAIDKLPETAGLKNEVVIQKSHKCGYEPQMLLLGAKLVWVETLAELEKAINPRTAMLFFLNRYEPLGQINRQDWVRVGKDTCGPRLQRRRRGRSPRRPTFGVLQPGFRPGRVLRRQGPARPPGLRTRWWAGPT